MDRQTRVRPAANAKEAAIRQAMTRQAHWEQRRERLSGAQWLLPAAMAAVALLVGFIVSRIHVSPNSALSPLLFKGPPDEARRTLLTVATSIVGILALVIGLSMVAIQMATNKYSPRLLRNFLRDRPVQFSLGIFVGAITYNAAGLFTVGFDPQGYPRLAVTVGVASLFVCIAAVIYYLDHMVHSIQIDHVLTRIGVTVSSTLASTPPGIGGSAGTPAAEESFAPGSSTPDTSGLGKAVPLLSNRYGYIQRVHPQRLLRVAQVQNVTIELAAPIGGHVVAGAPLAWARAFSLEDLPDVTVLERSLYTAVHIGYERTMRQDVSVGLEQIVDIALLSMHNYDIHTAVQSTQEMAILLVKLSQYELGAEVFADAGGVARVRVPGHSFDDYLDIAVGQIRRRGAAEPVVLRALLDMLGTVAAVTTNDDRFALIRAQVQTIADTAKRSISDPADVQRVLADVARTLATLDTARAG